MPHPLVMQLRFTRSEWIRGLKAVTAEEAARRFDLDRTIGPSGRREGGDVPDAGPWVEFLSWAEAERWLHEGQAAGR